MLCDNLRQKKFIDIGGTFPANKFPITLHDFNGVLFFIRLEVKPYRNSIQHVFILEKMPMLSQIIAHLFMLGSRTKTCQLYKYFSLHSGTQ